MNERIESMGGLYLMYRTYGRLRYAGIKTVGQLVGMTEQELLDIPRLGPVILADIKRALAKEGLQLKA